MIGMKDDYLFEEEELNSAGRATRSFDYEGQEYVVEEEKVGIGSESSDATILRVFDEIGSPVLAATYMKGLEDRTEAEYSGMGEPLNTFDEFDNPLHAVNQITGEKLSERSFSQNNGEHFDTEELEVLEVGE